jgi:hypothetical protein
VQSRQAHRHAQHLVDQHGRILLSDTDPPVGAGHYRRKWPDGDQVQAPDDLNHVLGILFLAAVEYEFIVSECDAGGNLISLRKHCTYKSTTATDKFFDPVRVFTI